MECPSHMIIVQERTNSGLTYIFHKFLPFSSVKTSVISHELLHLDRTVCLPLYAMWPSFGYFITVMEVNFDCANSTTSANFKSFLCTKRFQKFLDLKIFIIFK